MIKLALKNRANSIKAHEEGTTLVEWGLVCAFVLLPILFGIFQFAFALYSYSFVSDAARKATRYAVVRGVESCAIATAAFPDCNLSPTSSGNPLQTLVRNMGYPGLNPNNITVTTTWWSENVVNPGTGAYSTADWNTQCTSTDLNGNVCNTPGDAVRVVVTYAFPFGIPFFGKNLNLSSTSQMMISD
jgi:Flp pilus assembly protein TadG